MPAGTWRAATAGGSSRLALYEWEAAAQDAGVSAQGSGFRGASLHYNSGSREGVDGMMHNAVAAGGSVVREAVAAPWGGYLGDPDGHLRKVTTSAS